ncbi:MAG: YbfB/YjiJ family MFS transporter [Alphaproteobacteria bacterium]|nr:YbfB/YjiJ family MFS transporter [Alphaproteobacteria bacterium]
MPAQPSLFRISLVGLLALAVAMGIGRFAFTPLLPLMQDDGLASVSNGGLLASVHFLGYLLGALFAAKLPGSPKAALRLSLIAIGIGTLGMGLTENFPAWLFFRWLCGVCSAFTLVLVSNYYVKHLAAAGATEKQGWVFAGVGAGIAAAGLATLIFMVENINSALAWQILGAGSLILVVALCVNMGNEIPGSRRQSGNGETQRSSLHWRMVIAYGTAGLGYIIPATYLPVMAREIIESPIVFGWSWPVFGIAAFASTLLAARLERRFTTQQIWIVSQFIMAAGLLLPTLYPNIVMINVAGLCVGGTFMIITMAGMKEAHRIAPADDVVRHIAAMTAAFAAGQMIGPLFGSAIYDAMQSFTAALVITSVALVATTVPLIAGTGHANR